ncbi:MAG: hypothetical protein NTY19_32075 [Planctomycetota bacterium]|nr:hypothetical protein [Planctomycetota bacterium]
MTRNVSSFVSTVIRHLLLAAGSWLVASLAWKCDLHIYLRNMLVEREGKALKPQASR